MFEPLLQGLHDRGTGLLLQRLEESCIMRLAHPGSSGGERCGVVSEDTCLG